VWGYGEPGRLRARSRTARCSLGRIVPRRQDAESQLMGHMLRIGLIAAVLQSFILLDRRRVGEMQLEAGILQAIDQPIPVVGRLDHDACHLVAPARQNADDLRDLVQKRFCATNVIGITAITLLLECRSIPPYIILASSWPKVIRRLRTHFSFITLAVAKAG
jgi:hypothetical protein